MTINRIITNRFKLEIQSKKEKWTQTAGSDDWTEFSVDWPCTWKFSRSRKLSVSRFSRLNRRFSRLNHAWKLSGSRFSRLNRLFSRLNLAWAVFQPIQMKSKLFQNATGRTLALRVYANRQPDPICSSMHHQKHDQPPIKVFSHKFDLKTQKLEYSQNQSKSRANAHEEVLGIHIQQPKIIIVIDVR